MGSSPITKEKYSLDQVATDPALRIYAKIFDGVAQEERAFLSTYYAKKVAGSSPAVIFLNDKVFITLLP